MSLEFLKKYVYFRKNTSKVDWLVSISMFKLEKIRVLRIEGDFGNKVAKSQTWSKEKTLKTLVFTTSISKGIYPPRFNRNYEHGFASFARFHGAKAEYMPAYVVPRMSKEKPAKVFEMSRNKN